MRPQSRPRHRWLTGLVQAASCAELCVSSMRLGTKETRALVAAMAAGVGSVQLGGGGGAITLDMAALVRYNGRGSCDSLQLWHDTWHRSAPGLAPTIPEW